MCNCGDDEVKDLSELVTPRTNNNVLEQQRPNRQKTNGCCKAKRTLTYDDEVTIREIPIPPPLPPSAPRKSPGLRRCELAGVAIVRRRIDFGPSPEKKDEENQESGTQEASNSSNNESDKKNAEDKLEGEKDKEPNDKTKNEDEKEKVDQDSEKVQDSTTPQKRQSQDKNGQAKNDIVVTSTPCPGMLNPQNDCNCSAIPKT